MKKAIVYLLMALSVVLTTSCLKDQEDVFALPSSNRIQNYIGNTQEILTSSQEGWVFECFPHSSQNYGGYSFVVRFTDDTVYVRGELDGNTDEYTSFYSFGSNSGPVLSFDSYNEMLHYFATPSSGLYEAYGGDPQYLVLDVSEDQNVITLKGLRSGSLSYLRRLPAGVDGQTYLDSVMTVSNAMNFKNLEVIYDGDTLVGSIKNRNLTVVVNDSVSETVPFVYTLSGMKFYKPLDVFGQEVTGVNYAKDATEFAGENTTVMFVPVIPPLNEQFLQGIWYIAYSNLGTYGQSAFNQVRAGLEGIGEELYYANLGDEEGTFGLNFASYDGSSLYGGSLFFDTSIPEGTTDEVTLQFARKGAGDGVWYHNNAGFNYALLPFGYSSAKTFKLETDNEANPSYIILIDKSQPTNVIKLTASEVLWPFDN